MSTELRKQLGIGLLVLLTAGACHKTVDPGYPDERGDLLADLNPTMASASFSRLLDWSPDGNELYYLLLVNDLYELHALTLPSRTARLVARDNRWNWLSLGNTQMVLSPDGRFIYLVAQQVERTIGPYFLYQVATHQQNQVTLVDSSTDKLYPYGSSILLSPDGNRLSFRYSYDSVRVHNLTTKSSVRLLAQETIAFAPDARRLLLSPGSTTVYRNVSLTDFSSTEVTMGLPSTVPSSSRSEVRWNSDGIRYLYGDFYKSSTSTFGLYLWNVTQQKSTLIRPGPDEEFPVLPSSVVWSRDGQRIAFTTSRSSQSLQGSVNELIYSTDLTSLKTTKVATVILEESEKKQLFGQPLMAPDQSKLAYAIGSKIYSVSLQP